MQQLTGPQAVQREGEMMTTKVMKLRTAWGAILRSERGDVPGGLSINSTDGC
mgnify:FL=1